MSPKIGMRLEAASWARAAKTPAQRITLALFRMRSQGIPLRHGDHGVVPCPLAGGWCLDRHSAPRAVNVVGAVVLAFQPEQLGDEEPGAAAARALEVPLAYVEGLADGWDRQRQSSVWLSTLTSGAYLDGYEAGMEARFKATTTCDECGVRRFREQAACTSCT